MFGQNNNQDQQQPWQPQAGQFGAPQPPQPPTPDQAPVDTPVDTPAVFPPQPPVAPTVSNNPPVLTPPELPAHGTVSTDDLLQIKQDALQQLSPLVGHLEQSPEEKFRTTMMMIQASDDHSLLQAAYEAAKAISDEKSRAQALLDVVNEINYFTQQHEA